MKYEEYAGREGDIVTGIIQQSDSRYTLLDLGRVEALLPQAEQVPYERPEPGTRLKAYIVEVRKTAKGPQIVVSAAPTPASSSGCSSSRCPRSPTASSRSRPAPASPGTAPRSPSGPTTTTSTRSAPASAPAAPACAWSSTSCGARRSTSSRSPTTRADFVAKALSPAKVKEVRIDEETGTAEVIVPDYQLSLAIGKEGQNARLAARLTGWRVDIKSETQLAEEEAVRRSRGVGRGRVGRRPRDRRAGVAARPRAARRCRPRSGTHAGDDEPAAESRRDGAEADAGRARPTPRRRPTPPTRPAATAEPTSAGRRRRRRRRRGGER